MSALSGELRERAKRHGLVREEADIGTGWSFPESRFYIVGRANEGWWWWAPGGLTNLEIERGPHYPTEAPALEAALHWLDHRHPERAWRSSHGTQLAEALKALAPVRDWMSTMRRLGYGQHTYADMEERLGRAVALFESLALPSKGDEGAALAVAWDYLCERGGLPESAQETLVRAVRAHPEVVERAQLLGPWQHVVRNDFEAWERHVWRALPGVVLQVCHGLGGWWWFAYEPGNPSQSLASQQTGNQPEGRRLGQEAADAWALENGWVLAAGTGRAP